MFEPTYVHRQYIFNPEPAATPPSTSALTPQDQELLRKYRVLTPNSRDAVNAVIDTYYSRDKPKTEDGAM